MNTAGNSTTTTSEIEPVPHPAKFSPQIIEQIRDILKDWPLEEGAWILDPFGGVGGVHQLGGFDDGYWTTVAVEIEKEWADQSKKRGTTFCADFFKWQNEYAESDREATFDAIVTSPTYGNRMADHHEARDNSKRMTYRHQLGRALADNNSGKMQWGAKYRRFHMRAWARCHDLLTDGGVFILNVKDHVRRGEVVPVMEWHLDVCRDVGFEVVEMVKVPVSGMGFGANQQTAKVDHEWIVVMRKTPEYERE